jgi:prolipoprotein diacylglyceryltransferase
MAVYVAGYGVGRLWVESLRIDPAHKIAGLRVNQWTAILAILGGVAYTVWAVRRDGVIRQTAGAPQTGVGATTERP